jgi:hydroxyethylthiazole kinase-like uncharacterized protein yjeF
MPCGILTVAQAREADAAAVAAGVPSFDLMRAAGAAVARAVQAGWASCPVAVLCGPGLNGGDGYVAAAHLREAGWPVRVLALTDPSPEDARKARALWNGPVEPLAPEGLAGADLVIDALFGAGLSRPLPAEAEAALRKAAQLGLPIVAVDLPSGLPGDRAEPLGWASSAALTVTFHRKKPAHVLLPGRRLCGRVEVADIGIPPGAGPVPALWENDPELWLAALPWPAEDSHKHRRGRLGVVSGGLTSTGAARLAARAGLRAGAGLVKVFCAPEAAPAYAPLLEAVMLQPFQGAAGLAEAAAPMQAMVIGPAAGLDRATRNNLLALARTGAALVIDADALTVFQDDPAALFAVLEPRDVLTPHVGEFERLFPGLLAEGPERITAARRAAAASGAVVLLKGPDTVVAAPDGRAVVNGNGSPWLATAGSGDVLAGIIGGLLAQGMDSFLAAAAAVWIHADAADRFGPGLIAEDLPDLLPEVLVGLLERAAELGTGPAFEG